MRLKRLLVVGFILLLLSLVSHAFAYGALFPWSPLKPGYASRAFERTTVVYPEGNGLPAALAAADSLVGVVEEALRLRARQRIRVVVADSWELFNRGTLLGFGGDSLQVLGAALQTGTVVYLSPLAREPGRDLQAVLKHELVHALLFQQMPLRRTFELVELDWFEEGLAVRYGNPGDYPGDALWREMAGGTRYCFVLRCPAAPPGVPEDLAGPFRLAEYRLFVAFLMGRYGEDRFFAYRDRVLAAPARHEAAFREVTGASFGEAVLAFDRAVEAGAWPASPGGAAAPVQEPPVP